MRREDTCQLLSKEILENLEGSRGYLSETMTLNPGRDSYISYLAEN